MERCLLRHTDSVRVRALVGERCEHRGLEAVERGVHRLIHEEQVARAARTAADEAELPRLFLVAVHGSDERSALDGEDRLRRFGIAKLAARTTTAEAAKARCLKPTFSTLVALPQESRWQSSFDDTLEPDDDDDDATK